MEYGIYRFSGSADTLVSCRYSSHRKKRRSAQRPTVLASEQAKSVSDFLVFHWIREGRVGE